jgi:hypothetical protein
VLKTIKPNPWQRIFRVGFYRQAQPATMVVYSQNRLVFMGEVFTFSTSRQAFILLHLIFFTAIEFFKCSSLRVNLFHKLKKLRSH